MVDLLARPDARQDVRFLIMPVQRNERGDWLADDLGGGVAEQCFRAPVPADNPAIEILGKDSIVRGLDEGGEALGLLEHLRAMAHIDQHVDRADHLTMDIKERRWKCQS